MRKIIVFLDYRGILNKRGSASLYYFVYYSKVDLGKKEDVLNGFRKTESVVL